MAGLVIGGTTPAEEPADKGAGKKQKTGAGKAAAKAEAAKPAENPMLVIEMPGAKQDPRLVVQESKPLCMSDIAKAIQKSDPNGIGLVNSISLVARMSTGVFPIDYQTGGGWLAGRINILWAKEGAGKTLLTLLTIRADQILNPTKKQVLLDIEGRADRDWICTIIPYPDNLYIIQPVTVEEAIDKAEAVIMATDVSLLIFDSIAMMTGENELNSEAGKAAVGGASNPIGKLMRKMTARLNDLKKYNRHPTIILINQVRHAIGQLFGNPEKQPGGNAPRFMSSMTLWLHGKNEQEKGSEIVQWKATTCTLHKWTTKVLAIKSEYNVCVSMVHDPATGEVLYMPGDVYDWPLVKREMERLGLLIKQDKGGYAVMMYREPKEFRVLADIEKYYLHRDNRREYLMLKTQLIRVALERTHGVPANAQPS